MSRRRPLETSIRSTIPRTSSSVSTIVVSSLRPFLATNTCEGEFSQISSTPGSSSISCSGPKPPILAATCATMVSSSCSTGTSPEDERRS